MYKIMKMYFTDGFILYMLIKSFIYVHACQIKNPVVVE